MCRNIALLAIVIILLLAALAAWLAGRRSPQPALLAPSSISPRQAQAAQNRLEAALYPSVGPSRLAPGVPAPASEPSTRPVERTVRLAQSDINTVLASNSAYKEKMAEQGVQNAALQLSPPDTVTAYGRVRYHGQMADIELAGNLSAAPQGGMQFTTRSVKIGDLPVPLAQARQAADQLAAKLISKAEPSLPITVRQVSIQNGQLVLQGPAK